MFDVAFGLIIIIVAKKNRRLLKIRALAREQRKLIKNSFDGSSFIHRGMTAKDEIIRKRREWMGGQLGPREIPERFLF
jgi:hypothetical protein